MNGIHKIFKNSHLCLPAVCLPDVMTSKVQETFIGLWQPLEKNGVIPSPCGLASPLNPRTVMLIAQSPSASHQMASWAKLERFLTALLMNKLLTPASLQEQCIALLRHSWPQVKYRFSTFTVNCIFTWFVDTANWLEELVAH